MHPGVGRDDPGGREERTQSHHAGGEKHDPLTDAAVAVDHDPEETGFEEKGRDHLHADNDAEYRTHGVGVAAPVQAELEGHYHSGYDPEAEADGEDLAPEAVDGQVDLIVRAQVRTVHKDQK